MPENPPRLAFRAALPGLAFLTAIFFLNFLARVVIAPLLLPIEEDLGLTHAQAGGLFVHLALGLGLGLFGSGFVSSRLTHRATIGLSCCGLGLAMAWAAAAVNPAAFRAALFLVGAAAGLYLPSGVAAIAEMTRREDWGKALAVHELAPNLSFLAAPVLVEVMLRFSGWRSSLGLLSACLLVLGLAFLRLARTGSGTGDPPNLRVMRPILASPAFWLLTLFLGLAIGASLGPYAMIPLRLVAEEGYGRAEANALLAWSRLACPLAALGAGFAADRLGLKTAMGLYFAGCAVATAAVGLTTGVWAAFFSLLQPVLSVCFFPAGFAAASLCFPGPSRSAAMACITPLASLLGIGVIPPIMAWFGQTGDFGRGFVLLGLTLALGLALLPALRLPRSM